MGKIEDIFKEEISLETAETREKISELRRTRLEQKFTKQEENCLNGPCTTNVFSSSMWT